MQVMGPLSICQILICIVADQKKMVLMEQFSKLSDRQREKLMEKKRKRKASKEKKRLPFSRRAMD